MDAANVDFYASPGPLTRLPVDLDLGALPTDLDEIRSTVQGLLVHWGWAQAFGIAADDLRKDEQSLRTTDEVLRHALALTPEPITVAREPIDRVVGICRHFAMAHVALLRNAGIPARVRCGFGRYFEKGKAVDHWITERYDGERWVRDDPQIDAVQAGWLKPSFDVNDQPPGYFLTGSEAWVRTRAGKMDPNDFGIFDMWGQAFIGGNVLLDFACINKVELLPWDSAWDGLLDGPFAPVPEASLGLLDELAALVNADDVTAIRNRYDNDDLLRVGPEIGTLLDGKASRVRLDL